MTAKREKKVPVLYRCDPELNEKCRKSGCYKRGGPCWKTFSKKYAEKDVDGNPIEVAPFSERESISLRPDISLAMNECTALTAATVTGISVLSVRSCGWSMKELSSANMRKGEAMTNEIQKGMEYDYHTDSIHDQPECPHCKMPIFGLEASDIGSIIKCPCCEKDIQITDSDWLRKYIEDYTGEKTEEQKCMGCGGKMTVHLIKRNREWRIFSGKCENCGLRFIV